MTRHKLQIGQTHVKITEESIWDHRSWSKIDGESSSHSAEVSTISKNMPNTWYLEDFTGPKVLFSCFLNSADVLVEKKRSTSVSEAYVVFPRQTHSRYFDFCGHCPKITNIKRDLAWFFGRCIFPFSFPSGPGGRGMLNKPGCTTSRCKTMIVHGRPCCSMLTM